MALYNLVCAATSTLGTGSVVAGVAVAGYNNWSGVPNGAVVSYGIRERNTLGILTQSEAGLGTWNAGTSTLSRDTVRSSTNGGAKINLTTGLAEVYITAHGEDFDHARLLNIGSNTHTQIDAHIANVSNPHSTTAAQVGASPLGHSHSESDPIFLASVAAGIDAGDIAYWSGKQDALGFTPPPNTRLISTTSPLSGGGDLSADRTLTIQQANTSQSGYLSNTDWNTFNAKQPAGAYLTSVTADSPLSGAGTAASHLVVDLSGRQPLDTGLTSLAGLAYVSVAFVKMTGVDTFTLDTATYEPADATIVKTGNASWIDLTDGGATTLHSHAGGSISGSGVVGQLAEWVTNTTTLQAAKLIGPASNILTITNAAASTLALAITSAKTLTLTAADNYTLTLPATGTVDLLGTAQTITAVKTFTAAPIVAIDDAVTNTITTLATFDHTTSGTAAAGFGSQFIFRLETDNGTLRNAGGFDTSWVTATDLTRASKLRIGIVTGNDLLSYPFEMTKSGISFNAVASSSGDALFNIADSGALYFRVTRNSTNGHVIVVQSASSDKPGLVVKQGSSGTGNLQDWRNSSDANLLSVQSGGHLLFADAINIITNATTGTKIATATTQKLGFWNVTPIIQPAGAAQVAPAAYVTGIFGLDSNAHMQALYDLVVAMRTALVNSGIMKGAA